MHYVAEDNAIFLLDPPYRRKEEIKEVLSPDWSDTAKRGKGWKFPRNLFVYRELYKFFEGLRKNPQFMADYKAAGEELEHWMEAKNDTSVVDSRLREYQNQDVNFLAKRGSALVLNEPRTGKTPTMITLMKVLRHKRNLVICPASLVLNWAQEFHKWHPEMKVHAVSGTPKQREVIYENYRKQTKSGTPAVLIVSKDTWKSEKYEVRKWQWDVTVVDEAHFLRNIDSAQSTAILSIKSHIKYALTGTPTIKHGSDVYGLLHFIKPEEYSSFWGFTKRYWELDDNGWGVQLDTSVERENRKKELLMLMASNSVQRKRKEVMQWLPDQTRQTIPVEMDKKQAKLYAQMLEDFVVYNEDDEDADEVFAQNKLTQQIRLRQICLDPRLIKGLENCGVVGAKTKALIEFADDMKEPFVVFSMLSSYFDIVEPELRKLGKRVKTIRGNITKKDRDRIVRDFQNGTIDIILANITAAGVGLTLDRADTVVFMDKAYTPAENAQAEDRIVPTTKDRLHPINIISFVTYGTVDERINELLEQKENVTKIINNPELFRQLVLGVFKPKKGDKE